MPAGHKNFLLRHFDKIICGVVGLMLVAAIVYGVGRAPGERVEDLTRDIETLTATLEQQMESDPPEVDTTNYVEKWRSAHKIREPGEVQEIFWYPWPVFYEERRLAADQDYQLQFDEPLAPQSVEVEEEDPEGNVIENVVHPVGIDYSMVEITTADIELGEAVIAGRVGKRTHRMPIVVDEEVQERAEPPVDLSAKAVQGGIVIRWSENPDNTEAIELDGYEVFRKRANEVSGEFVKVGTVDVEPDEEDPSGSRPSRGQEDEDEESETRDYDYSWEDGIVDSNAGADAEKNERGVRPGETYLYRVRSIAGNSEPPASEYTSVARETALPTVDYQFTGRSGDKYRFEVCVYKDGDVGKESCDVRIGEEIGKFDDEEGTEIQNYLTGCYLLDFHSGASRLDPFTPGGRVVILNRRGQVVERWKNETEVEYLWELEEDANEQRDDSRPGDRRREDYYQERGGEGYRDPNR